MTIMHVVSESTGKDSTPTLLYALHTERRDHVIAAFADTGNEHEAVYDYLDYLDDALGIKIVRLKRDFTPEWEHRRQWLMSDAALHGNLQREAYTEGERARMLEVFDAGPTGNPYLDLCIIKGRFPSRRAQFCTQFLKTEPLVEFQMQLIDSGQCDAVWSWQGVRRDESSVRRHAKEFEEIGGGLYIYRPIARWKAQDCFDTMAYFGIKPNPLYAQGCDRVGCMPCINSSKAEIRNVAKRWPEHINRIEQWEGVVAIASRREAASFFPAPTKDNRGERQGGNIRQIIQWSKTTRGGKQQDLLADDGMGCASSYGLCDTGAP